MSALLTAEEICQRFGVSRKTVSKWKKRGLILLATRRGNGRRGRPIDVFYVPDSGSSEPPQGTTS